MQSEAGNAGLWLDMIILSLGAITKCRPVPAPVIWMPRASLYGDRHRSSLARSSSHQLGEGDYERPLC